MLRQDPVKKKRGKLNIERRFLPLDIQRQETPSDNITTTPQPESVIETSNNNAATVTSNTSQPIAMSHNAPAAPTPVAKSNPTPSSNSNSSSSSTPVSAFVSTSVSESTAKNKITPKIAPNNVTKIQSNNSHNGIATAMPDSDWRIGQYHLPEILMSLAKNRIDNNIDNNVDNDVDNDNVNDSNADVFAMLNDSLKKAKEFDDKLFISIFESAIRASCQNDNNGLAKETLIQLQQIDGFNEHYKTMNNINEKLLQAIDGKLTRESKITTKFPLLTFPQSYNDSTCNSGVVKRNVGGDFFVTFNNNGVAINPTRDFWEGLYQLGGVIDDVKCVIITTREKIDRGFVEQLRFFRNRQAIINQDRNSVISTNLYPIQLFVPNELSAELSNISNTIITEIESISADGEEVAISDDIKFSFQADQLSLRLLTVDGSCQIRFIGQSGLLRESLAGDVLVFPIDNADRFFSAVGFAKIADAGLTIFDIPHHVIGLTQLIESVRKYSVIATVAGLNLVCDVGGGRFLDVVKGFDSDDNAWSSYSEIDNCDDYLYYFAKKAKERFTIDNADIIETFLTNRRRRHGLYFE
ncbi:MAG: hypothetical protein LBB88_03125 [Planctomycetaceae bacterium]|jgi:hypothetical protein|nr:hypothetical protein [Planctomycetaceae bacterium]